MNRSVGFGLFFIILLQIRSSYQQCNGSPRVLTNFPGSISSPGYPSNYPANQNCNWRLEALEGNHLIIDVKDIHLENSVDCYKDKIKIKYRRYRDNKEDELIICGRTDHSSDRQFILSSDNRMEIHFRSNKLYEHRGFQFHYDGRFRNVASGMSTRQSTTRYDGRSNGDSRFPVSWESCRNHYSLTKHENNPWWGVQLAAAFRINRLYVKAGSYNDVYNFDVSVGDTDGFDISSSRTCGDGYLYKGQAKVVECGGHGRMVYIRRTYRGAILSLCRVLVYVETCQNGLFGAACDRNCSSHCTTSWCGKENGECECRTGYYGRGCNQSCPEQCLSSACDRRGDCSRGCQSGYWGSQCQQPCSSQCLLYNDVPACYQDAGDCDKCRAGYYGVQCKEECKNCRDGACNKGDGRCQRGCKDGYRGERCDRECSPGSYGGDCMETCEPGCSGTCNNVNGSCTCLPGFTGIRCEDECPGGWYGFNCSFQCSPGCRDSSSCSQVDGSCSCAPGYKENRCDEECSVGTYGDKCSQSCPDKCDGACHHMDGVCSCSPGFTGRNCTEHCPGGSYGRDCKENCNEGCSDVCHRVSGNCECKPGYQGDKCEIVCTAGTYGSDCMETCSQNCVDPPSCSKQNGSCECKEGFEPPLCMQQAMVSSPETAPVSVIAGSVAAVLIIIVIIILLVVLITRRKRRNSKENQLDEENDNAIVETSLGVDKGKESQDKSVTSADSPPPMNVKPEINVNNTFVTQTLPNIAKKPDIKQKPRYASSEALNIDDDDAKKVSEAVKNTGSVENIAALSSTGPATKSKPGIKPKPKGHHLSVERLDKDKDEDKDTEKGGGGRSDEVRESYENIGIHVDSLPKHIKKMKHTSKGFAPEYKTLPVGLKLPCVVGSKSENQAKNRFKNIIAYDHTRVILTCLDKDPASEYVNANYIENYDHEKAIAAQGPLSSTLHDFLRLLWEQSVPVIVMVTNLKEDGKTKCETYWPSEVNKALTAGDISVKLVSCQEDPHYTTRKLQLERAGESKSVTQVQYTSWPDKGVPNSPATFLQFLDKAQKLYKQQQGPTLVHCSAGVGRTGTYLAVQYLLAQAAAEDRINVVRCIERMREQRVNMVQSLDQYIFIYETLLEAVHCGQTMYSTAEYNSSWKSSTATIDKQFEVLDVLKPVVVEADLSEAQSKENESKNRDEGIVPANHLRPLLMTRVQGSNTYINAVFVHGYNKKNEFLVTQSPLVETVVDYWRLVKDYNCATVVSLQNNNQKDVPEYIPEESKLGPFTITKTTESESVDYTTLDTTCSLQGDSIKVRHFIVPTGTGLPNINTVIAVYEIASRWHHQQGGARCLIQCLNGCNISGLFLAVWFIFEKITEEKEVDIFHAVRHIRTFRQQFIINKEQYQWLHQAAETYLNTLSTYANFQ